MSRKAIESPEAWRSRVVRLGLCMALVGAGSGCAATQASTRDAGGQSAGPHLLQRGLSLERAGQLVSAEQYLVAARSAGVDARAVLPALLRVCLDAGRPTRALEHARDALRSVHSDPQLWTLAAALAWGLGRTSEAERYLHQALGLPGPPPETAYWQGRVAARAGQLAEAARRYGEYLALAPTGPFAERARFWLSVQSLGDRAAPSRPERASSSEKEPLP